MQAKPALGWYTKPFVATLGKAPELLEVKSLENVKTCLLHPEATSHDLIHCRKFLNMTVDERWKYAKKHRLCFLCFGVDT